MIVFLTDEKNGLLCLDDEVRHDYNTDKNNSGAMNFRLQYIPNLFNAKELECGECLRFVDENDNTVLCGSQVALLKKELDILDSLCSTDAERAEAFELRLLAEKFHGSEDDTFIAFVCDETVKAQHPDFLQYDENGLPVDVPLKELRCFKLHSH